MFPTKMGKTLSFEGTTRINTLSRILFIILLFSAIFLACNAPRSNPLDPENPVNADLASIEGTIQTISLPYTAIPGVMVLWIPGNKIAYTDDNGNFSITGVKQTDGLLIFEKNGYRTDTLNIKWEGQKKLNKQISLGKTAILDSLSIYTIVRNQVNSIPDYELDIETVISDPDNNIDSVFVENSVLKIKKAFNYDVIKKTYFVSFTAAELNVNDLEKIIGLDFNIIIKDKLFQKEFQAGAMGVTRVIKNTVNLLSPVNGGAANSSPLLSWEKFNAGYNFTYMIEIYTNDLANPQLIKRVSNIPAGTTSYQVTETLSKREYYWVAWVIDNFNNRSRSKPEVFVIQ